MNFEAALPGRKNIYLLVMTQEMQVVLIIDMGITFLCYYFTFFSGCDYYHKHSYVYVCVYLLIFSLLG